MRVVIVRVVIVRVVIVRDGDCEMVIVRVVIVRVARVRGETQVMRKEEGERGEGSHQNSE